MNVTIVALGDSTTAGTPAFKSPIEAPPNGAGNVESQYAYWLRKTHADWRVLNRGVNGERSDQIRSRCQRDVVDARPDAVVFCDTRAAVAQPGRPDQLVSSPDGLHPSPQGYKLMAEALEPAIRAALAKAQALR